MRIEHSIPQTSDTQSHKQADEISQRSNDIWGEFESMMAANGGNVGYNFGNQEPADGRLTFKTDMYR